MDIQSAFATISAISEVTKAVINGKIDEKVKQKAAELNNSIISLQSTIFSLQTQNHELLDAKRKVEEENIKLSNWNQTADKYFLDEICPGVFVFSLKKEHQNGEPFHHICPACYENRKWSVLIKGETTTGGTKYSCKSPDCKATYNDYCKKEPIPNLGNHGTSYF